MPQRLYQNKPKGLEVERKNKPGGQTDGQDDGESGGSQV